MELLSIALTGADASRDDKPWKNGAFFIAIDPTAIRPLDEFRAAAETVTTRARGVPAAPGSDGVKVPGEPEHANRAERRRDGIPIAEATWEAIHDTARSVGTTIDA